MRTLEQSIPISSNLSTLSLRPKEMPSNTARDISSSVWLSVRPVNVPRALPFQLGVIAPPMHGRKVIPFEPIGLRFA